MRHLSSQRSCKTIASLTALIAAIIAIFSFSIESSGYASHANTQGNGSAAVKPEHYEVIIQVTCEENILFSRYDVSVSVDGKELGIIDHGTSKTLHTELTPGMHQLIFANKDDSSVGGTAEIVVPDTKVVKYELACKRDQIIVTEIHGDQKLSEEGVDGGSSAPNPSSGSTENSTSPESSTSSNDIEKNRSLKQEQSDPITPENNPSFNEILQLSDNLDPKIEHFASSNVGRTIAFNGYIADSAHHETYKTRFDVLIYAGNAENQDGRGPAFQFQDVSYYDMHSNLETVAIGTNVRVTATVEGFDSASGLLRLKPISVTGR